MRTRSCISKPRDSKRPDKLTCYVVFQHDVYQKVTKGERFMCLFLSVSALEPLDLVTDRIMSLHVGREWLAKDLNEPKVRQGAACCITIPLHKYKRADSLVCFSLRRSGTNPHVEASIPIAKAI
jgi:hypothetical protein